MPTVRDVGVQIAFVSTKVIWGVMRYNTQGLVVTCFCKVIHALEYMHKPDGERPVIRHHVLRLGCYSILWGGPEGLREFCEEGPKKNYASAPFDIFSIAAMLRSMADWVIKGSKQEIALSSVRKWDLRCGLKFCFCKRSILYSYVEGWAQDRQWANASPPLGGFISKSAIPAALNDCSGGANGTGEHSGKQFSFGGTSMLVERIRTGWTAEVARLQINTILSAPRGRSSSRPSLSRATRPAQGFSEATVPKAAAWTSAVEGAGEQVSSGVSRITSMQVDGAAVASQAVESAFGSGRWWATGPPVYPLPAQALFEATAGDHSLLPVRAPSAAQHLAMDHAPFVDAAGDGGLGAGVAADHVDKLQQRGHAGGSETRNVSCINANFMTVVLAFLHKERAPNEATPALPIRAGRHATTPAARPQGRPYRARRSSFRSFDEGSNLGWVQACFGELARGQNKEGSGGGIEAKTPSG
ncbi:hypothetical protein BDK51DRAFT_43136 [Blyttiomyces helicus]|uniref:Uncharacterized protein n=1 Tax=Blyttiomyces helicus TaxID=388810 RepID=A0A4P9W7A1_9FUNG|nr:hypothetical protein BDK51DRAFT_43136 [Blyttiomyces helicus]|eukprot:RKO87273.1 hypothetical protein BDK51DRAFT_43136 [Blyttiomyces helicus]